LAVFQTSLEELAIESITHETPHQP